MALISEVITASEAAKISAKYVIQDKEYAINYILSDIRQAANQGKNFLYYSRKRINEWFWAEITSYYCFNYFQKLGYKMYTESNYYKENDEICMIRW